MDGGEGKPEKRGLLTKKVAMFADLVDASCWGDTKQWCETTWGAKRN